VPLEVNLLFSATLELITVHCSLNTVLLLRLFMCLVLAAAVTKLLELETARGRLLVLRRRVVPLLALRALQRHNLAHFVLPSQSDYSAGINRQFNSQNKLPAKKKNMSIGLPPLSNPDSHIVCFFHIDSDRLQFWNIIDSMVEILAILAQKKGCTPPGKSHDALATCLCGR
jgi:hypothetical protein